MPGATLPVHNHPYPRYGYVLAGILRMTNIDTGLQMWKLFSGVGRRMARRNQGRWRAAQLLVIDV